MPFRILPEHVQETETFVVRALHRVYTPVLNAALGHRAAVITGALVLLVVAGVAVRSLGLEFPPTRAVWRLRVCRPQFSSSQKN